MSEPTELTPTQKLHALAHKYYQHAGWNVQPGDYYTSCRADLELYKVVKIENDTVYTTYLPEGGPLADWPADAFQAAGFGLSRCHVPSWIFDIQD